MAVSAPGQPAAPGRVRRLIRPALWRAAARGLAAVLVIGLLVAPLATFGWTMVAIFVAVTVGLNLGLWAGRDSGLASLAGAILMPVIGLIIALTCDVQIIGSNPGTIALEDVEHFPYADQFRFTEARVATEFATSAKRSWLTRISSSGTWRVAPLVPEGWRPAQRIPAWAVARVSGYGPLDYRTPRSWQQSYRAGVRYAATALSPAHAAIEQTLDRFDLRAAPHAALIYWVDEPRAVISDERTYLAWVIFGGVATWLLFIIGEALLVPAAPPPEPDPPPRERSLAGGGGA
jgi:hypothetical protein